MVKKKVFNPSAILTPDLVISSAGSHLYRIGLSFYRIGSESRPKLNNPLIIFTVNTIIALRHFICQLLSGENRYYFELLSDWTYFLNGRQLLGVPIILIALWANISQIIHYWYYKNDIKPQYLKPFQIMSGLVSPQSVGLYNQKDFRKMIKRFKILFKLSEFNASIFILFGLFMSTIPIVLNCSLSGIIFAGIPWFIVYTLYGKYVGNFFSYQTIYFYGICYYLRLKLRNINNEIEIKIRRNTRLSEFQAFVKYVTRSLNSIYLEITEYNDNYWSTFLFMFTVLMTICINGIIYKSFFGKTHAFLVLTIRYFAIACPLMLLILFFIASSVFMEANRSYKLLNKLFVHNMRRKFRNSIRIKVSKKFCLNT
jgi:hypothetical protein